MKNVELTLLGSGDGTEIIHHLLYAGARWAMVPAEDWTALEHLTVLSGSLLMSSASEGEVLLEAGDSVSVCPVKEHTIFTAKTDVAFLYVTSQPQFHFYSNTVKDMMDLAIQVERKDGYTAGHCNRIKELSMVLGKSMGLNEDQLYILNLAAFLHDIGKVKVPDEILQKPAKLTSEEYDLVKRHTVWGREILEETGFEDLVKAGAIVEQHHERFDGKGYPSGLQGDEIRLEAAIISVADAFDAIISDRVYRKGMSMDEAFGELQRNKGTMFHPDVVDAFLLLKDRLN